MCVQKTAPEMKNNVISRVDFVPSVVSVLRVCVKKGSED